MNDSCYNVPIKGHIRSSSGGFAEFAEASGEMSSNEFVEFLIATFRAAVNRAGFAGGSNS